jgi:hypothetical protein
MAAKPSGPLLVSCMLQGIRTRCLKTETDRANDRGLKDKAVNLNPVRRAATVAEADRLQAEYRKS